MLLQANVTDTLHSRRLAALEDGMELTRERCVLHTLCQHILDRPGIAPCMQCHMDLKANAAQFTLCTLTPTFQDDLNKSSIPTLGTSAEHLTHLDVSGH